MPRSSPSVEDAPAAGIRHLILYDGVCGLCDSLVRFVLLRDAAGLFGFSPLESDSGRLVLNRFGKDAGDLETVYLVADCWSESPTLLSKAQAALFVVDELGGGLRRLRFLRVLPTSLLDWAYDLIARNRYRSFGRNQSCQIPSAQNNSRLIGN